MGLRIFPKELLSLKGQACMSSSVGHCRSSPGLLHCSLVVYLLSHQGSPWAAGGTQQTFTGLN